MLRGIGDAMGQGDVFEGDVLAGRRAGSIGGRCRGGEGFLGLRAIKADFGHRFASLRFGTGGNSQQQTLG